MRVQKKNSLIFVHHGCTGAASEGQHCCTPGAAVPGFLVINGAQTIGITQLCYSIHFRTSDKGQAATIWHNWAPFLTNAVYCFLDVCCRDGICSQLLRPPIWIFLLVINNKSIIRNSSGFADGGYGMEEDKVSAVGSTLSLPGAEEASVKALGWLWYFHPSSACSDLDSIRPSRTGGQRERREERPLPDADSCPYIYYSLCCNSFCLVFDTILWHAEAMLSVNEGRIRICFTIFNSLASILLR